MNLVHNIFMNSIQIDEDIISTIIIENKKFLFDFINELRKKDSESISIYENNKEIDISKNVVTITDFTNLELNTTKVLSKIYSSLIKEIDFEKMMNLNNNILSFIDSITLQHHVDLEYDLNVNYNELFKSVLLKVKDYDSQIEKLLSLLNIKNMFDDIKLFIFINLKSYFSIDEVNEIFKYCINNKIRILLIESYQSFKLSNENIIIIDNDLCVID